MSNIVVLGDGLLGSEIVKQTNWDCVSRKKNGFDINSLDVLNYQNLPIYNTIVNCIACTDTYSLEKEKHWDTNYKFVYELALFCNKYDIKLVHISTDFLYSNNLEPAKETDLPLPAENWYSTTKLLADNIIELVSNNYLICRGTHIPKPFPYDVAFIDRIGNFDYVDIIASLIIKLVNLNAQGLYNVGTKNKNMYELAKLTNPEIQFTCGNGVQDTSMDITKLQSFLNLYQ